MLKSFSGLFYLARFSETIEDHVTSKFNQVFCYRQANPTLKLYLKFRWNIIKTFFKDEVDKWMIIIIKLMHLTDTGENVQEWTRVFSTRCWVILVARTHRNKKEENSVSTFGRFRLWTSFESSPVSVKDLRFKAYLESFSQQNISRAKNEDI